MSNSISFGDCVTLGTGIVLLATLIALVVQIVKTSRGIRGQALYNLVSWIQREEIRKARSKLFDLERKGKNVANWTDEEKGEVGMVCHTYDTLGIMVREHILTKRIARNWAYSVKQCWKISEPLIKQYRDERKDDTLWDNFHWLAQQLDDPERKEHKHEN